MKSSLPTLRWAAGGLLVMGILTRLLGLLRENLIARYFGASAPLDAVLLGLSVSTAIGVAIGGGLARAGVPSAAALDASRFAGLARAAAARLTKILLPLSIILAVLSPLWVLLLIINQHDVPRGPLRVSAAMGSLTILGSAMAGLYVGLLNAKGRHVTGAINLLLINVVVCSCLYFLHEHVGVYSLALGLVAAEWVQLVVLLPSIKFIARRARAKFAPRDLDLLKAAFWPSAAMGLLTNINLVVDRSFAALLPEGGISALSYADKLVNLPVGLIGMVLAVPLFTRLSRLSAAGESVSFQDTILLGVRLLLVACAPVAVLLAAGAEPIIGVLLQYGSFDESALHKSAVALCGYAIGIPFIAMVPLLTSAGLTIKRPWLIVAVLLLMAGLNVLLDAILVRAAGIFGIALATTIVSLVRVVLMILLIAPGVFAAESLWLSLLRTTIWCLVLAAPLAGLRLIPGFFASNELMIRIALLGTIGVVALVVTGLLWRPLLRREWKSLSALRGRTAQVLARLQHRERRARMVDNG